MTQYENAALEDFRRAGYQVEELGIDREGIVYADLGDKEEAWGLAVMAPGEEPRILWTIGIPVRQWLPGCCMAAAAGTGLVLAAIFMALFIRSRVRVIPVTVRIASAALLVPVSYTHLDVYKRQVLYGSEGAVLYEGGFVKDLYEGEGRLYDEITGGLAAQGTFIQGVLEGNGTEYDPATGMKIYEGTFRGGLYDGTGVLYDRSTGGKIYEGQFLLGQYHGCLLYTSRCV